MGVKEDQTSISRVERAQTDTHFTDDETNHSRVERAQTKTNFSEVQSVLAALFGDFETDYRNDCPSNATNAYVVNFI